MLKEYVRFWYPQNSYNPDAMFNVFKQQVHTPKPRVATDICHAGNSLRTVVTNHPSQHKANYWISYKDSTVEFDHGMKHTVQLSSKVMFACIPDVFVSLQFYRKVLRLHGCILCAFQMRPAHISDVSRMCFRCVWTLPWSLAVPCFLVSSVAPVIGLVIRKAIRISATIFAYPYQIGTMIGIAADTNTYSMHIQ